MAHRRALAECMMFLKMLDSPFIGNKPAAPSINISSDFPEVALSWQFTNVTIEIAFIGDAQYSLYAIYPDGRRFGSRGPFSNVLPAAIIEALSLVI